MIADLPPPMDYSYQALPYEQSLATREADDIDLVVIHCTETPDLKVARDFGEKVLYDSGTGNSGHFYIDRDGSVYLYIKPERIAHHTKGYNPRSIGIELVNTGRYPNWYHSQHQAMDEPYTSEQIASLQQLLLRLRQDFPSISLIAGHEDLDTDRVQASDDAAVEVARKRDPGPLFPWAEVLESSQLTRLQPESGQGG